MAETKRPAALATRQALNSNVVSTATTNSIANRPDQFNCRRAQFVARQIPDARLRHLARRIHALGERPLFELLKELVSGADVAQRLEAFAALDPEILAALGGVALPPVLHSIDGGAS